MTLKEVKDWFKTQVDCPNWYIGKIDASKEQCIGVYDAQGPKPGIALGGIANTSYSTKVISVLIHWGNDANLAEIKAQEVYNKLFGQTAVIGGKKVIQFDMKTSEPIGLGTDENGIYEYTIYLNIIYER